MIASTAWTKQESLPQNTESYEGGAMNEKKDLARPFIYVKTLRDIGIEYLSRRGILYLIIDWDQTLWNRAGHLSEENVGALKGWIDSGMILGFVVLSNSVFANKRRKKERIMRALAQVGLTPLEVICLGRRERKPRPDGFVKATRLMRCHRSRVAVIGDQIVSDIVGGNSAWHQTILVDEVGKPGLSTRISGRARRNKAEKARLKLQPRKYMT